MATASNLFVFQCLKWKLIFAVKGQYGWPGFIAPFFTRYLTKVVTISQTPTIGGPTTSRTDTWQIDRLTGNGTELGPDSAIADFPYGDILPMDPVHSETWTVTETYFKHVYNNGAFFVTTEVQLSNPYDLGTVEADADALIAGVDLSLQPWNTLQFLRYPELSFPLGPYTPVGDLTALLPPGVVYPNVYQGGYVDEPVLLAAAWAVYAPGFVFDDNWYPNGFAKLVGYIRTAGFYCKKTTVLDYSQRVISHACASGIGRCSTDVIVQPPAIVTTTPQPGEIPTGQDAYVILQPHCKCP